MIMIYGKWPHDILSREGTNGDYQHTSRANYHISDFCELF